MNHKGQLSYHAFANAEFHVTLQAGFDNKTVTKKKSADENQNAP